MSHYQLGLEGIYNSETAKFAYGQQVESLAFDFHPLSLNFCQQHIFLEMLPEIEGQFQSIFLQFKNDHDYVIQKMLDDIQKQRPMLPRESYPLAFIDGGTPVPFDCFKHPFYFQVNDPKDLEIYQGNEYCRGILLDHGHLLSLQTRGQYYDFLKLVALYQSKAKGNIILQMNWGEEVIPSLLDSLPIDHFFYGINSLVETQYRQVNFVKLNNQLNLQKNFLHHEVGER